MINVNKGMYLEELVNRTINYYDLNNLGHIEKRQIPIKILKHVNDQIVIGKLIAKSKVDYFLYINNQYAKMECKQTNKKYFALTNLKKHQLNYFLKIKKLNICCFLLINFEIYNSIIAIKIDDLIRISKQNKKQQIDYSLIKNNGIEIEIIYPGILNLEKMFR